jgi:hypothetical protein
MTKVGVAVLAVMWAGTAWAGCSNWAEDSDLLGPAPRAKICIAGSCEETTVDYNCGNAFGAQWGYHNGLTIEASADGTSVAYKSEHEIDLRRITCTEIDEGSCFISP